MEPPGFYQARRNLNQRLLLGTPATGYSTTGRAEFSMNTIKKKLPILLIATIMLAPAGCKRGEDAEGPAERAGRQIDNALEKAGQEPAS